MTVAYAQPRMPAGRPLAIFGALAAIGALVFLIGIASSDADTVKRTYRVFLHNWLLWAALAQGGLCLSAAFRLTNARWMGPIRQIADSIGAFAPLSLVLFFFIYLGRHELFEWTHHPVHGKEWWFNEGFAFTRDVLALVWMTLISFGYLYLSTRPMLGRARESVTGWRAGVISMWTSGWRGDEAEARLADRRARKFSAVLGISYVVCYSLLGLDLIMSLAPHWVSTMFPAYYCWGGFLSAIAMTTVISLVMRDSNELKGQITEPRRHDLGKMMFAFSIFWMYLFWSQYIVIWYANIPEETGFVAARLGTQFLQDTWYLTGFFERIAEPYVRLTLLTWALCWVVPFWVLLGARPKKTPAILGTVAVGSLVGFWLERYILVTPSLVGPEAVMAGAPVTPFGWIEIGVALGFIGLFFLSFLAFAKYLPGALPVGEGRS